MTETTPVPSTASDSVRDSHSESKPMSRCSRTIHDSNDENRMLMARPASRRVSSSTKNCELTNISKHDAMVDTKYMVAMALRP
jgi:hypothetical protein